MITFERITTKRKPVRVTGWEYDYSVNEHSASRTGYVVSTMWPFSSKMPEQPKNLYEVECVLRLHIPASTEPDAKIDTANLLTFLRTGEHSGRQVLGHECTKVEMFRERAEVAT